MARCLAVALLAGLAFSARAEAEKVEAMECSGGSLAACQCLLGCSVFGGNADLCTDDDETTKVVEMSVKMAIDKEQNQCEGMTCVTDCARKLNCFDKAVQEHCANVKKLDKACNVDCSGAQGSGAVSVLVLALALGLGSRATISSA
mmetsp:Transcript_36405/g.79631  ORF Transcript_36405/g.79631 Transcript_36405/m.79631 type:complete len:146 (-) Transcript_36405:72-509(-)